MIFRVEITHQAEQDAEDILDWLLAQQEAAPTWQAAASEVERKLAAKESTAITSPAW